MKRSYIIGVDIGGTNSDAVLVDANDRIVSAVKAVTTEDISLGFADALNKLLLNSAVNPKEISGVFLGTTHATNALLQKKDLFRVGVIRIAGQRPQSLPVAYAWPKDLKDAVIRGVETVGGGFECNGGLLTPLRNQEIRNAIERLLKNNVESIAVVGVFSPLNGEHENTVSELIREIAGNDFPVSLSNEIGGIGFLERENSTILNAALKRVMETGFRSLQTVCKSLNLICPLMITQNDGSLIDLNRAMKYPVLTISAGPTNSFIGGTRLTELENAVVVDIGGTSTDVGLVRKRFPVRSLNTSNIGGVSLNFPMPDVLSIALGGGSLLNIDSNIPTIGPISVAKSLMSQALSFGGSKLTLTDAALAMGFVKINGARIDRIKMDMNKGISVFDQVVGKLNDLIVKMSGEYKSLPTVFVGGGSALLPPDMFGGNYLIPKYFDVANAYGAALSEISGTVDTVVSLKDREKVLSGLYEQAQKKAVDQGAKVESLRLVDQQIIPYSYVPNQMARVIVRFSGVRDKSD